MNVVQSKIRSPFKWAMKIWEGGERIPSPSCHRTTEAVAHLEPSLVLQPQAPKLAGIVVRHTNGTRSQPQTIEVTPSGGLWGDRWAVGKRNATDQISMMNLSVAHHIANGQSVVFSGDNLFADLDISTKNLPAGTRLVIGEAIFEVSAEAHTPCHLFKARFGDASFRRAANVARVRGVYLTVLTSGEIRTGDDIEVLRSDD